KECRRAFPDQGLGDLKWLPRYPGQSSPKLNIAGVLADFASGRTTPKPNRFEDRPALIDEGMRGGLQGSITENVISDTTVRIGSDKAYAAIHQEGGESEITVTKDMQDKIRNWLYPTNKAGKRVNKNVEVPMFKNVKMA